MEICFAKCSQLSHDVVNGLMVLPGEGMKEPIDNLSNNAAIFNKCMTLIYGQFMWKMKNIQDSYLLFMLIKRTKHENRFANQCWIMADLTIIPYLRITTLTS